MNVTPEVLASRIENAIDVIDRYGSTDGAHHKQWVLDQVLRELMSAEEYREFVDRRQRGADDWETGIAP